MGQLHENERTSARLGAEGDNTAAPVKAIPAKEKGGTVNTELEVQLKT